MNLQQIEYFFAVAETGSFTQAAELIYTSQPTISRQILLLERELGYSLFNRDSKPLKLTPPGEVLYTQLKKVIHDMDRAIEVAKIASEGKAGRLSLSFQAGYYPEYIFLPTVSELRDEYPDLNIHCLKQMASEIHVGLNEGSVDLAIGLDFPHWHDAGYKVLPIAEVDTLVVMPASHRLANKTEFQYNDFSGETFYLTGPNGYEVSKVFGGRYSLDNVIQAKVPNSETAYFKALSENGLTISNPYDPTVLNNPFFHYAIINPDYKDRYVLIYKEDNTNPSIQVFINKLKHSAIIDPLE